MPMFRKKPVVIEAQQFRPGCSAALDDLFTWLDKHDAHYLYADDEMTIGTLEDGKNAQVKHVATSGDWIIRGIQGEFYPCKPTIFDATYEPASSAVLDGTQQGVSDRPALDFARLVLGDTTTSEGDST